MRCEFRGAVASLAACALVLSGCGANNENAPLVGQGAGMVTGGVVGGYLGEKVGGKGGMIVGALLGTMIGGVIGYEIGKSLSEADRKVAHQKFALGMSDKAAGQTHTWTTPDRSATANYTAMAAKTQAAQTRLVRPSNVEAPSQLDVIAELRTAQRGIDIKSKPDDSGKTVAKLVKGEKIMVVGQVADSPWYFVSRNNIPAGYVKTSHLGKDGEPDPNATLLMANAPQAAPQVPTSADMVVSDVPIRTTCRDMSYEIVKNGAKAEEGTFSGCKQIDGNWRVQPQQASPPQTAQAG